MFTKSDGIFLSFSLCEPKGIKNKNTKSKKKMKICVKGAVAYTVSSLPKPV